MHPLVQVHCSFHTPLTTSLYREVQQLIDICHLLHPVHLLHRIQFKCYAFFNATHTRNASTAPQFQLILDDITRQIFQYPFLPAVLEQLLSSFNIPVFPPMHQVGIPGLAALSDTLSHTGTVVSLLSGATPHVPSGKGRPGGGTATAGTPGCDCGQTSSLWDCHQKILWEGFATQQLSPIPYVPFLSPLGGMLE